MATYYVAEGGTATDQAKENATSGTYPGGCLSPAGHNAETFSAGDSILFSDEGGVIRATITPPSSGSSGTPITYGKKVGDTPKIFGSDVIETWTEVETGGDEETGGRFASGMETAALSDWSLTEGSATIQRGSTQVNNGTYSMEFVGDGSQRVFTAGASFTEVTSGDIYARFYIYIPADTVVASGVFDAMILYDGSTACLRVRITADASENITMQVSTLGPFSNAHSAEALSAATWYSIEVLYRIASGTDGGAQAWLDNVSLGSNFAVDTSAAHPDNLKIGLVDCTSGKELGDNTGDTIYFDDCKVDTSKIGLFSAPVGGTDVYTATCTTEPKIVAVDDVKATLGGSATTLNDGEWFWAANVLYYRSDAGDPDTEGLVIEAGARNRGINVVGKDYITAQDLIIGWANQNAFVSDGCTATILDGATLHPCGYTSPAAGVINFSDPTSGIIRNCTSLPGAEHQNMYIGDATTMTVEDNTIGASAGKLVNDCIQFANGTNITIQRNVCDMEDVGTDVKGCIIVNDEGSGVDGVLIQDNYCKYGTFGISVNGDNVVVRRNRIENTGAGTAITWCAGIWCGGVASDAVEIYHNVISGCVNGMHFYDNARTDHKIYNNTVYNSGRYDFVVTGCDIDGEIKNNIFYSPSASQDNFYIGGVGVAGLVSDYNLIEDAAGIHYDGTDYATLALYQAGENPQDANSITGDPKFTSAGTGDLTLASDSTCIGAGVNLGASYDDALMPSSTWPDGVVTGDQDDY